jgi:hypothetical protein
VRADAEFLPNEYAHGRGAARGYVLILMPEKLPAEIFFEYRNLELPKTRRSVTTGGVLLCRCEA